MVTRWKVICSLAALAALLVALCAPASAHSSASQPYHFGFKKSKGGAPASINEEGFKHVLEKYGAVFRGGSDTKTLYLTFDNGYENGFTPHILDVLKQKRVPAAFFVTGHYVKDQPELIMRMAAEGHIVGNHSWSHPDMTRIGAQAIHNEMDKVKAEVAGLTGQPTMAFMRPPRGIFSDSMLAACKEQGYTAVFWSIAYKDWDVHAQKGKQYAYDQVVRQLHPGAVILLHAVSSDNAEALADIIDEAVRQGYTFKSLDDLL